MSRGWWATPMPQFGKVKNGYAETQVFSIYRRRWQFRIRKVKGGWTAERWGCNWEPYWLEAYVVTATGERVGDPIWNTFNEAKSVCYTTCLREGWRGKFEPLASASPARFATTKEQRSMTGGKVAYDPKIPSFPNLESVKLGYDIVELGEKWDTGYENCVDDWEEKLKQEERELVSKLREKEIPIAEATKSMTFTPAIGIEVIVLLSTMGAIDSRDAARSYHMMQSLMEEEGK